MTILKLKQGTPITLNAYYVGASTNGCHIVRLKMHKDMPENDGQLMLVCDSVINEIPVESEQPVSEQLVANLSETPQKPHKPSLPHQAANEHPIDVWGVPVSLGGL